MMSCNKLVYTKLERKRTEVELKSKKMLGLDKDGVIVDLKDILYIQRQRGFLKYGIKFEYDKDAVHHVGGIYGYNGSTAQFKALYAFGLWFEHNKPNGITKNEAFKKLIARPDAKKRLDAIISKYMSQSDLDLASKMSHWDNGKTFYGDEFLHLIKPCEGAKDALIGLCNLYNGNVAIITNTVRLETVKRDLEIIGLSRKDVNDIVIINNANKPNPESLDNAINNLKMKKGDACFVGDNVSDVQTAQNSGVASVGVLTGMSTLKHLKNAGADAVATGIKEFYHLVRN